MTFHIKEQKKLRPMFLWVATRLALAMLAAVSTSFAQEGPPVTIKVSQRNIDGRIVYLYRVTNNTSPSVVNIALGHDLERRSSELLGLPVGWDFFDGLPSGSALSPPGWQAHLVTTEESDLVELQWSADDPARGIELGASNSFGILLPEADDQYREGHWMVILDDLTILSGVLVPDDEPAADATPPVITPVITGSLGNNGWYTSNVTVTWSASDPESGILSSPDCGTIVLSADTQGRTLTCSATNWAGLTDSASVTIKLDKTPPTISSPNVSAGNDAGKCSATLSPQATANDNFPGVAVSGNRGDGKLLTDPYPVGVTSIAWTAEDRAGNRTSSMQSIVVADTEPISIKCPENMTVTVVKPGGTAAAVTYPVSAVSDNCEGASFVCNPPSGSVFPAGITTVTCTATDAGGNKASCSFTVNLIVYDVCMQDDSGRSTLRFSSISGDYQFFDCAKGTTLAGRGVVTRSFCKIGLLDNGPEPKRPDRNVNVLVNPCTGAASATIRVYSLGATYNINDGNMSNSSCSCSSG